MKVRRQRTQPHAVHRRARGRPQQPRILVVAAAVLLLLAALLARGVAGDPAEPRPQLRAAPSFSAAGRPEAANAEQSPGRPLPRSDQSLLGRISHGSCAIAAKLGATGRDRAPADTKAGRWKAFAARHKKFLSVGLPLAAVGLTAGTVAGVRYSANRKAAAAATDADREWGDAADGPFDSSLPRHFGSAAGGRTTRRSESGSVAGRKRAFSEIAAAASANAPHAVVSRRDTPLEAHVRFASSANGDADDSPDEKRQRRRQRPVPTAPPAPFPRPLHRPMEGLAPAVGLSLEAAVDSAMRRMEIVQLRLGQLRAEHDSRRRNPSGRSMSHGAADPGGRRRGGSVGGGYVAAQNVVVLVGPRLNFPPLYSNIDGGPPVIVQRAATDILRKRSNPELRGGGGSLANKMTPGALPPLVTRLRPHPRLAPLTPLPGPPNAPGVFRLVYVFRPPPKKPKKEENGGEDKENSASGKPARRQRRRRHRHRARLPLTTLTVAESMKQIRDPDYPTVKGSKPIAELLGMVANVPPAALGTTRNKPIRLVLQMVQEFRQELLQLQEDQQQEKQQPQQQPQGEQRKRKQQPAKKHPSQRQRESAERQKLQELTNGYGPCVGLGYGASSSLAGSVISSPRTVGAFRTCSSPKFDMHARSFGLTADPPARIGAHRSLVDLPLGLPSPVGEAAATAAAQLLYRGMFNAKREDFARLDPLGRDGNGAGMGYEGEY